MHRKGKQYVNAQRAGGEITFASRGGALFTQAAEKRNKRERAISGGNQERD